MFLLHRESWLKHTADVIKPGNKDACTDGMGESAGEWMKRKWGVQIRQRGDGVTEWARDWQSERARCWLSKRRGPGWLTERERKWRGRDWVTVLLTREKKMKRFKWMGALPVVHTGGQCCSEHTLCFAVVWFNVKPVCLCSWKALGSKLNENLKREMTLKQ